MEINFNIEKEDIDFVESILKDKVDPIELKDVTLELAFFKTRGEREKQIKIYDSESKYKKDDLIHKIYSGKIPVGAKNTLDFNRGVILKVVNVRNRFGLNEIELSYDGTSDFRKYINYLKRQKIGLFLPHMQADPPKPVEYLEQSDDPRCKQSPMIERDIKILNKKLLSSLSKTAKIVVNSDKVLLKKNLKKIDPSIFTKIKEFLSENKKSEKTEFFVENFLNIQPDHQDFISYCFTLNHTMSENYKIDYKQTSFHGWGKWQLISVIFYLKRNSLFGLKNPLTKNIELNRTSKKLVSEFEDQMIPDRTKYFLTQREISSGALRIRANVYNLANLLEIHLLDQKSQKEYQVYYYHDSNLLLGLNEIFEDYKVIQGSILTLEQVKDEKFEFNIRISKKGIISNEIIYDDQAKVFIATDNKISSPVFISRTAYLEPELINKVAEKSEELKSIDSFKSLTHKIFIEFGQKENNYELNIFSLFHLLDLIYPSKIEHLLELILNNNEFIHYEKRPGSFFLDSSILNNIEEEENERRKQRIETVRSERDIQKTIPKSPTQMVEDERRKKREDRRKKRESEMWEKIRKTEVVEKPPVAVKKEIKEIVDVIPEPVLPSTKEIKKEKIKLKKEQQPEQVEKTRTTTKKDLIKQIKKNEGEELDMADIKSEIKLEELKEKVKKVKPKSKSTKDSKAKVAYKDKGGSTGAFASLLDDAIKDNK